MSYKYQPPIIAVFSQECPKYKSKIDIDICPHGSSYLPHSYVKFIEASGGEALILPTYTTNEQLENLILKKQISGILLPGGGGFKWEYYRLARAAVRLVLDHKIDMPIFGICMGFELMLVEASEPNGNTRDTHKAMILENISGTESVGLEVEFSWENLLNYNIFEDLPKFMKFNMENLPITMNAHINTVFEDTFKRLQNRSENNKNDLNDFIITSTSTSPDPSFKDRTFVASVEHKNLPLFSVQYHPEKANFEINNNIEDSSKTCMIHSLEAIQVSQYLANFFVEKCRKFQTKNSTSDESKLPSSYEPLKAKYQTVILPTIGSKMWKHYNSIYVFRNDDMDRTTMNGKLLIAENKNLGKNITEGLSAISNGKGLGFDRDRL